MSGTDRLYHTTEETFSVVQCGRCRLMRLMPVPSPGVLHSYYPKAYWHTAGGDKAGSLEEKYRRLVLWDHVRFVERALREADETGPVLDVGCGGGLFLRMLRERGHRVLGLDFALDAANAAWSSNGVPAFCASLTQAPLPPASCSAVTMFHVLEHLYHPHQYLDAAHKLLRPDGRLIVQVPNAACWQFLLLGEMWNGVDIPRHLFHFRASDLEILLESCGFEVLRRKHFSLRDNPAGLATSLVPSLDPMARRIRTGQPESSNERIFKDLIYLLVVLASVPFTVAEAACRAGSTIMIEARKKST